MSGNIRLTQILLKRGNTAAASSYTGPIGEVVIDTDLRTLRIQDGVTVGGHVITTNGGTVDLSGINSNIASLTANAATQQTQLNTLTANAATQQTQINSLQSTVSGIVIPTVPTTVSSFTNDTGYITNSALSVYATSSNVTSAISTAINNLINSAPGTLDTLAEIAANLATESGAIGAITTSITNTNANVTAANTQIVSLQTQLTNSNSVQATLTNKTLTVGYSEPNHLFLRDTEVLGYAGSGGVLTFQSNPTFYNLFVASGSYLGFASDGSQQTTAFTGNATQLVNGNHILSLDSDGLTQLPGGAFLQTNNGFVGMYADQSTHSGLEVVSGDVTTLFNTGGVVLASGVGSTYAEWQFGADGNLTLPVVFTDPATMPPSTQNGIKFYDGIQTRAWTGIAPIATRLSSTSSDHYIEIENYTGNVWIPGNLEVYGSITLDSGGKVSQSNAAIVTNAEAAFNAAKADWVYHQGFDIDVPGTGQTMHLLTNTPIGDGVYFANVVINTADEATQWFNWMTEAYTVQNGPYDPNIQLWARPAMSQAEVNQILTLFNTIAVTGYALEDALKSVDLVAGNAVYTFGSDGNITLPHTPGGADGQIFNVRNIHGFSSSNMSYIDGFGTITAGNLVATSSIMGAHGTVYADGYFWSNGVSILSGIPGTYTNSNVAAYLPTYDGNIAVGNINASNSLAINVSGGPNNSTFTFGPTGLLTAPGGINTSSGINMGMGCFGQAGNNFTIGAFNNNNIQIQTNGASETWTFQTDGQLVLPLSTQSTISAGWVTSTGNIGFNAGGNLWRFGSDGTMTSPYNVKVTTAGIQYADGSTQTTSYSNANVTAYLPTDATITSLQANITAANTAIITANTSMKSYVDTRIAASSYGDANVAAYLPTYTGNVSAGNINLANTSGRINLPGGAYIWNDPTSGTRLGSIILQPNTAASSFPGVQIGGAGRINAPNGSTHMILNTADVTIQVPLKLNTGTVSTSTTTGAIQVSGGIGITGNTYIGGNVGLTSNATVWGDFSNSTVNYRTIFQTSTANGTTGIYAVPNGTSTGAAWQATNNSNLTNASKVMITTNGTTDVQLVSGINGTGTYLPLSFLTNGATQMQLSTTGNLTMSNGGNIITTGNAYAANFVGVTGNVTLVTGNYNTAFDSTGNITLANVGNAYINGSSIGGNILIDPLGPGNIWLVGNAYVTGTITGTVSSATTSSTASSIGFLGLPQNSQGTNYGLVIGDAGKHIYVSATSTVTIPTYTSVNFPIGSTITFIAGPSATATIAITTDTMYLAGTGTTGSRTLAPYGMATAIKVAQGTWYINGSGLS